MSSIAKAALAALSVMSLLSSGNAQAGLSQAVLQGCYSTAAPMYTNSSLTYKFQTSGWCQEQCGGYAELPAFALSKGSDCYCGEKLPPNSTKVDDDECDRPCQGYPTEMCGGMNTFSVYTSGLTNHVEIASDSEASSTSSGSASSPTITKAAGVSQTTNAMQTVTQAGSTIVVTAAASASASSTAGSSKETSGGTSKAGIAAGIVVGIILIGAIAGGAFFFVRHRKRRAIEEEHQRQQSINTFGQSAPTIMSERSTADSRLDPTIMYRRQSDGSIADERDLSRRVLTVTNPDRNTMMA